MDASCSLRSTTEAWWLPLLAFTHSSSYLSFSATLSLIAAFAFLCISAAIIRWCSRGGPAWSRFSCRCSIPGPRGLPFLGSLLEMHSLAHQRLAHLASSFSATSLMAFSLGNTPVILTCSPTIARDILHSSSFADRPIKQSARLLLFDRAIGFAPYGDYWRNLRRIAATHLFAPKRIAAHEPRRQLETSAMLHAISRAMCENGVVRVRTFLQQASVNNVMSSVFGRTYDFAAGCDEANKLQGMIREGFELLGAFNWGDHLPFFSLFDTQRIAHRCSSLVEKVKEFVQQILDEHRSFKPAPKDRGDLDFVDILLSLEGSERLSDSDMIAVLWEMIFRGTDTTAILMEWILAELVLHPEIQSRVQEEIDNAVGEKGTVAEADMVKLPYMQAVIKETLRLHPPGPLLSWARLAIDDVHVAGHHVPAGTTAMVNMWAITHDPAIWKEPKKFMPERFLPSHGGTDIDIRGNDLRLAPFGAGRRVCPGRALGQATVQLWTARLLHEFNWKPHPQCPVDLSEVLRLSCEMKNPLSALATPRNSGAILP